MTKINIRPMRTLTIEELFAIRSALMSFTSLLTKRRTAFVVLVAWIFALAIGIANACLLEPPERQTRDVAAALATVHLPATLVGHAGAADGHDSDLSTTPCLQVCEDSSRAVPKPFAAIDLLNPGPATVTTALWSLVPSSYSALRRADRTGPLVSGLPIQIRFARLTL